MSNLFDFKNVEQLHAFIEEIKCLKELIKCPVCLEITKDPIRIACDHIFCSNCLDTLINTFKDQAPNKKPQCPICRKAINGQRNSVNGYVESLLVFLQGVDASTHSMFGCDILALSKKKNIKLFKQNVIDDDSSSVIESTSYQDNEFDKLLNSDYENPMFKGRYGKIYSRNASKKVTVQTFDKYKPFENNGLKGKIHQWLENTKNQFDRLTQTQYTSNDIMPTQMSLNMPSVSQINYGQTPPKKGLKKRPKSFELGPKVPIVRLKRHSVTGESQELVEDIQVEDIKNKDIQVPNKEHVLRLLEEECLNSIDLELEESQLKELKPSNTIDNKNGWKRMKKMNKAITKNTRKKNKLNVTLTSILEKDQTRNKENLPLNKANIVKTAVVVLEKFGSNVEYSNIKGKMETTTEQHSAIDVEKDLKNDKKKSKQLIENNDTDFICSATRLAKAKPKLASSSIFSEDQCSVQCSKNVSHENCRLSEIETIEPKVSDLSIFDETAQTLNKLKTVLKNSNDTLDKSSLQNMRIILNDLNDIINGTEISNDNRNKCVSTVASTQTLYFDLKSVSVQTEIEATKSNRSESKEFCSIDIQTDNYMCESCNKNNRKKEQSSTNNNITPSEVLLNSKDLREFAEQMEIDDTEFKTQKVSEGDACNENSIIRSPLVPTQEIVEDEIKNEENVNINQSLEDIEELTGKKSSLTTKLSFSLSNYKVNSKEECEERIALVSKRFKRIRPLDVDSGEENFTKKTKIDNKYIRDNLSIEILSEDIADDQVVNSKTNSTLSLTNCNEVDYDAYLINIMKKYEDNPSNKLTNKKYTQVKQSSSKKTKSQEILDRCDAMIRAVTSIEYPKSKEEDEVAKNIEDITIRESPLDLEMMEQFDEPFDQRLVYPGNDKEPGSSPYPQNKKEEIGKNEVEKNIEIITITESPIDLEMLKEFDEPFSRKLTHSGNDKQSESLPCTESCMANINIEELEHSALEEKDNLNSTVLHVPVASKKEGNIIILNDIRLDDGNMQKKQGEYDRGSVQSEDLFNSEHEVMDEDVIETTPNKQSQIIQRSFSSHLKPKSLINKLLPPVDSPDIISSMDPTSFLDQTFTPPVDFQDDNNDENNKTVVNLDIIDLKEFDVTIVAPEKHTEMMINVRKEKTCESVIDLDFINTKDFDDTVFIPGVANKSLVNTLVETNTEKRKENTGTNDLSLTESELLRLMNTSERSSNVITSTQKTLANENFLPLGISPIRKEKKKNSIEIAQSTRFSPLNVISVAKPEKSKSTQLTPIATKQRSILTFVKPDKIDKNESIISIRSSALSPSPAVKPYVSCTRLNKEQMLSVSALSRKKLIYYTSTFSSQVTHVIVSVNKKNCLEDHTMKLLMAIAKGNWVLNFNWIKDCLVQNRILPEESYEALDMSGLPGPKTSRLERREKPLLKGYRIHLEPPFLSATKQDVEALILMLGGEIVPNIESLARQGGIRLIITEAKSTQDYYKCEQWSDTYKVISVDIEWLSRSIGRYQVVSLRPFALCSDDNLNSLGYPPELTVEISFSCSQSMGGINR